MRDRQLDKNIARLEALIEKWKLLSQFLDRGFQQNFTAEDEAAFLELKSQIAREYELMMTMLASMADREERALRLMNSVTSLAAFKDFPEGADRRIATEWHNAYIGWQALLGRLRGRQAQLTATSSLGAALRRVFSKPFVLVVMLALAGYGTWHLANDWLPRLTYLIEQLENRP
jgi:esterase/lipase superfamily enzyme